MILTEKTLIKVTKRNLSKLKEEYSKDVQLGDILNIHPKYLSDGSHVKIKVKCDFCNNEKDLMYQKYVKNINNGGFYACSSKCAQEKVKKTTFEKYGSEYYTQTEEYVDRVKKTSLEKYGVEHFTQNECVKRKQKQTNLEKYGVEFSLSNKEIRDKISKTNLEKYGVENPFESEEIKDKIKKTNLEKYGVEYPQQSEEIREKSIKSLMENYGVENPSYSNELKEKRKTTILERYGVENYFQTEKVIKNIKENNRKRTKKYLLSNYSYLNFLNIDFDNKEYTILCDKGHDYIINSSLFSNRVKCKTELCTICNPINQHTSGLEIQLLSFIEENYTGVIETSDRDVIKPLELDIYLPNLKLAFEFNGLYWHNELNKDNNYHLNKTDNCFKKGVQLTHIWEDDWLYKQDIVKSIILNKIGKTPNRIYARKCEIKVIEDNKLIRKFLDDNHLQGFVGSSIKLGLYYENELVSLMTFGKKRKSQNSSSVEGEFELIRFCNKLNTNVIGGASKLFKHFTKNYFFKKIISYADRSHSNGKLYENLGFELSHISKPNYYYVVDGVRKYRFGYRKDVLVKEGFDLDKSEHQIMIERGIYRIYNSGNYKYIFKN